MVYPARRDAFSLPYPAIETPKSRVTWHYSLQSYIDTSSRTWDKRERQVTALEEQFPEIDTVLQKTTFTCKENGEIIATIPFDQADVIQLGLPKKLHSFFVKFNGLCELICNKVLMDDLLGKGEDEKFLRKKLTVSELDKHSLRKSHLLNVFSIFHRIVAFVLGIYPKNIFSVADQWKLVHKTKNSKKEINGELLAKGLNSVEIGTTLKLEVFRKRGTEFSGHSLLIKKVGGDEFIFFDPNAGEHRGLTGNDVREKINAQLTMWKGTDVFLFKGQNYLKMLTTKKILKAASNNL